jgi:glycerol-3-phosphate dehydrogenase
VTDVEPLSREALLRLEPGLAGTARAAFRVPREYLIDPWAAPLAYLTQAMAHRAVLMRGAAVTGGAYDGATWRIDTTRGQVTAGAIINAAGLYGDLVDECLLGRSNFTIKPRKGQFVVYDKPAHALAQHILLPVPNKVTKGIVVCRTVWGNLLVGPTAEEQEDRANAVLVPETLAALQRRGEEILPGLKGQAVTAIYAGLRPATEEKDYRITLHPEAMITVGGIRSTGLSSALGTALHALALAKAAGGVWAGVDWPEPARVTWPRVPNISECGPRDWQCPGHGGIICHCELVTRREVLAAMDGPLGAQALAGLKRRTRVTMGRCQGFFCSAELARITEGRLNLPFVAAHG